jgi:D-alanyl-D-alanine carboxypeptidase
MKKIGVILLLLFLLIQPINIYAFEISSKHAVLYNLDEDKVIYEKDSNSRTSIASMTKIMTCLVALENIKDLNGEVTITSDMLKGLREANASVAGFYVGEKLTYLDLLYGLMLPSGADAAQALAITTSGSVDNFVAKMNSKASSLGLKNTHFTNTTGLDSNNHYSTVVDVATILKEALKNDIFKKIFTTRKYVTSNKRHTLNMTFTRKNYDTSFILGGKTGYTDAAGLCLASISKYNDVNYLLVTSEASTKSGIDHLKDAKTIYTYYFNNYSNREVLVSGEEIVNLKINEEKYINYKTTNSIKKYLPNNCVIKKEYNGLKEITEDINLGDKLGTYKVSCGDEELYSEDIYLVYKEHKANNNIYIIIGICVGVILLLIGERIIHGIINNKRNKRKLK